MNKKQILQDTLYQFIQSHNLKLARIADLTGLSNGSVTSCFNHQVINGGVPRSFTRQIITKMNEELPQMAEAIGACALKFGTDETQLIFKRGGKVYDKSLVDPIKVKVAYFFNINPFLERIVGWNKTRKHNVLETNTGKVFGNITKDDADHINDELDYVSHWLMTHEVVADEGSSDSQTELNC